MLFLDAPLYNCEEINLLDYATKNVVTFKGSSNPQPTHPHLLILFNQSAYLTRVQFHGIGEKAKMSGERNSIQTFCQVQKPQRV